MVRSTQDQEKHFDALVWSDSLHDPTKAGIDKPSVLTLFLDVSKEHTFEVSPPPFYSARLRPRRPPRLASGGRSGGGKGRFAGRLRSVTLTASSMLSQSSLGFGGDSLTGMGAGGGKVGDWTSGGDRGSDGNNTTEDARESYSSQMALKEPGGIVATEEGGSGSPDPASQSQGSGSMSAVFGRGSTAFGVRGGQRFGGERDEVGGGRKGEDEDEVTLEMSHVNKEPCMRSLLLVVEAEQRLFGEGWLDRAKQSNGV